MALVVFCDDVTRKAASPFSKDCALKTFQFLTPPWVDSDIPSKFIV